MVSKNIVTVLVFAATLCVMQPGCARFQRSSNLDYQTVDTTSIAKPRLAKRKHEKGICFLCNGQYALAEQLLQESLIADASYGPAHNTLGKVYFEQRKFYLAAWEFEHAIKAMPDRAEPINNLGLVYEAVGKLDDAVLQYEIAASLNPESAEYLGNLLRCRIRRGEHASTIRTELQSLIALDDRETWVRWAKLELTTDGTGQDWRQSGVTDHLYSEEFIDTNEYYLDAHELPLELNGTEVDGAELDGTLPDLMIDAPPIQPSEIGSDNVFQLPQ